jgi:hypothetical protein
MFVFRSADAAAAADSGFAVESTQTDATECDAISELYHHPHNYCSRMSQLNARRRQLQLPEAALPRDASAGPVRDGRASNRSCIGDYVVDSAATEHSAGRWGHCEQHESGAATAIIEGYLPPEEPPEHEPQYISESISSRSNPSDYLHKKLKQENAEKVSKRFNLACSFAAVVLSSMLCVFVPQNCGDEKICSFEENIDWNSNICRSDEPGCFTAFNQFVLVLNLFQVACFLVLYLCENQRESWLSTFLDIDRQELSSNIVHTRFWVLRGHRCRTLSQRLYYVYLATLIVFIFNVAASALLILPPHHATGVSWNDGQGGYFLDYRTATVFFTNVSLLFTKLCRGTYLLFCICLDAPYKLRFCGMEFFEFQPMPWGLSTVAFEPSSYNVVAPEVCVPELGAKGDLIDSWRLRNPDGCTCPHVAKVSQERSCSCFNTASISVHSSRTAVQLPVLT